MTPSAILERTATLNTSTMHETRKAGWEFAHKHNYKYCIFRSISGSFFQGCDFFVFVVFSFFILCVWFFQTHISSYICYFSSKHLLFFSGCFRQQPLEGTVSEYMFLLLTEAEVSSKTNLEENLIVLLYIFFYSHKLVFLILFIFQLRFIAFPKVRLILHSNS